MLNFQKCLSWSVRLPTPSSQEKPLKLKETKNPNWQKADQIVVTSMTEKLN